MAMTLVETITVGSGGAASVEFTGIPGTGLELLFLYSLRSTQSQDIDCFIEINADETTSNYFQALLEGTGSGVRTEANSARAFGRITGSGNTANTFCNGSAVFSNYTGTSRLTASILNVTENNATNARQQIQFLEYDNSAPMTQAKIFPADGILTEHSTASLYIIS